MLSQKEVSLDTKENKRYWAVKVRTMNGIRWLFYATPVKGRLYGFASKKREVIKVLEYLEIDKAQYLRGLDNNNNNKLS